MSAAKGYRADIDGLRAFAVSAVVAFHAGFQSVSGGFAGVDVFFVISGYLLGGIVHREIEAGSFTFTAFYLRRARRILPALLATGAATLGLGFILLGPGEYRRLAWSIAASLLGVSNVWFMHTTDYFTQDARLEPFLMTWSLGIEEQFYVLLPIALLLIYRIGMRPFSWTIAAVLCSLSLGIATTMVEPVAAFYLLPTRAWELGIGVALAMAHANGWALPLRLQRGAGLVGFGTLLGSVVLLDDRVPFPGYAALLPTLATATLIAAPHSVINRRVLASPPAVAIGLVSYSWYLLHWPLLALLRICAAAPVGAGSAAIVCFGAIVPAYAMWRWVEWPFRRANSDGSRARSLPNYGIAVGTSVLVMGGVIATGGLPIRLGPSAARVESVLAASKGGPCLAGYGVGTPNHSSACAPVSRRPAVALLGDSHAAALGGALRAQGREHGFDVIQFTASSCPPLLGATLTMLRHPGAASACADFNTRAITEVASNPQVKLVILAGFWQSTFGHAAVAAGERVIDADPRFAGRSGAAELEIALIRSLARLKAADKQVVLLGDVPWLRFDPALHAWSPLLPARRTLEQYLTPGLSEDGVVDRRFVEPLDDTGAKIVAVAAFRVKGVVLIKQREILCDRQRCRTGARGVPYFIDPQHLSQTGAAFVIEHSGLLSLLPAAPRRISPPPRSALAQLPVP